MAQLVEQRTRNAQVIGSTPIVGSSGSDPERGYFNEEAHNQRFRYTGHIW